jgi:GTP cyclohydrolase IA
MTSRPAEPRPLGVVAAAAATTVDASVVGASATVGRDGQLAAAVDHCAAMLATLGIPLDHPGVRDTPQRFVRALDEMTRGLRLNPDRHLAVTFPPETDSGGQVLVSRIPFAAVCEHHLLPFHGTASVAYIPAPGAAIVGLSKLARLVEELAARPQVQERLTRQIADAMERCLRTVGVACLIQADHACMSLRGARAYDAPTTTDDYRGVYRHDPARRTDFLQIALAGTVPRPCATSS